MSWYDRIFSAKIQGIARSILKRAGSVALVLVILQLFTLQVSVDNGSAHQQEAARQRLTQALDALKKTQAQSDAHNEQQNKKTQEYVKCLIGIVLLPLSQRPDDPEEAINQCGTPPKQEASAQGSSPAVSSSRPSTSTTNQPTTSAPPDPTARAMNRSQAPANPLIDVRLFLFGTYQTAKSVPVVGGLLP